MSADALLQKLIDNIIEPTVLLFFGVALVVFFWGIFQMVRQADNEEARKNGKNNLLWGTIGLIVMFAAQGLILIIQNTVGIPPPK